MRSRKAVAQPFQEWVVDVVDEIRKTGHYDVQEQAAITPDHPIVKEFALQSAEQARHQALTKSFEGQSVCYIGKVKQIDDGTWVHKVGETDNLVRRVRELKTMWNDFTLTDVFACDRAHEVEQATLHSAKIEPHRYVHPVEGLFSSELVVIGSSLPYEILVQALLTARDVHSGLSPQEQLHMKALKVQRTSPWKFGANW